MSQMQWLVCVGQAVYLKDQNSQKGILGLSQAFKGLFFSRHPFWCVLLFKLQLQPLDVQIQRSSQQVSSVWQICWHLKVLTPVDGSRIGRWGPALLISWKWYHHSPGFRDLCAILYSFSLRRVFQGKMISLSDWDKLNEQLYKIGCWSDLSWF